MRHRYQITVTDYRGARHFSLHQIMRHAILGAVGIIALTLLGGSITIHALNSRVSNLNAELAILEAQRATVLAERAALQGERRKLQSEMDEKSLALLALGDELEHIELLIGLRSEPERPLAQRVNTASQTAFEKRLMLRSIPSGWPVYSKQVTSGFGMRRHPISQRMAMHGGVDLHAPRGTPVYATADGVVEWAAKQHNSGMGKVVRLVHNFGFTTLYAHLDEILVRPGQFIHRGDQVGYSGNTGVSTAPHLHYEVRHLNRRLDPKAFMLWSMDDYDILFAKEEHVEWEFLVEVIRRTARAPERPSSLQGQTWSASLP